MKKTIGIFFVTLALIGGILALVYYPGPIVSSHFVQNPWNILSSDYAYATLQYRSGNTTITCPPGFFASPTYPNNFCQDNLTGELIAGWVYANFTNASMNNTAYATKIVSSASELNLGCTSCTLATGYKVFYTTEFTPTAWTYAGQCDVSNDANMTTCTLNLGTNSTVAVRNVLVARYQGGDFRPDPAVHWIRAES